MNDDRYDLLMNPAIGSIAISYFIRGYSLKQKGKTPLILAFLVLPIVLQKRFRAALNCSSNYKTFLSKINADEKTRFLLLSKHIKSMRSFTMKSILVASAIGLLHIDSKKGLLGTGDEACFPSDDVLNPFTREIADSSMRLGSFIFSMGDVATVFRRFNLEA